MKHWYKSQMLYPSELVIDVIAIQLSIHFGNKINITFLHWECTRCTTYLLIEYMSSFFFFSFLNRKTIITETYDMKDRFIWVFPKDASFGIPYMGNCEAITSLTSSFAYSSSASHITVSSDFMKLQNSVTFIFFIQFLWNVHMYCLFRFYLVTIVPSIQLFCNKMEESHPAWLILITESMGTQARRHGGGGGQFPPPPHIYIYFLFIFLLVSSAVGHVQGDNTRTPLW